MNESNLVQKFIWLSERAILLTIALATLFASASEIIRIISVKEVNLSDLFLLFIYAEVLGMVASFYACLLYTSPSPRDTEVSRMPSSA